MWIVGAVIVVLAISVPSHAQTPSRCVQMFDQGFRKCFRDLGGFELDIVFSLVTNETSGRLPPNLAPQKANLIQMLCANRQQVGQCIAPLVTAPDASCKQTDIGMMDGTINSMVSGIANLCGAPNEGSACMKNFDTGFRKCLSQQQINPDNFFMLLADQPLPAGVNKEQLKTLSCSDTTRRNMLKCSTDNLSGIQTDCKPQETIMVGTTLQNMMGAYEGVCTGKPINPDQCMSAFEEGMNQCAKKTLDMDMKLIIMVLQGQTLPAGQNKETLKKNICRKWTDLESCGKNVVKGIADLCGRSQMLMVEASFVNMMITTGTTCGDTTLPGACLLTLQKQFGTCFGKVGLSPDIYLSNDTEHKGALIGANTKEAEFYCSKKHDLFTCMNEVVQTCPGAEQTLSLTGFDLHGMERAVGILCHNIPDYLAGLDCFAKPTDAAKQCMEDMTMAITDLSTKQITQALNMDTFFADFCTARANHVACDGAAWPSCKKSAVSLKNEFECQLIPSRCYNSHKDNIDTICPNTDHVIPGTEGEKIPECVRNIHENMDSCFKKFNMKPDMFLMNITHDRSDFMGDIAMAKSLCNSKGAVFQCMTQVMETCKAAESVLSYWGHQQSSVEQAVNVICNDIQLYDKGLKCFANGNPALQRCISDTESKMMDLADKQVQKKLSPDAYFRDFCGIHFEQLRCELGGWKQTCGSDVVGLKTEFECRLIQTHCKNLQVQNYQELCGESKFAKNLRAGGGGGSSATDQSTSGTNIGNVNSGQTGGNGGASSTSGSIFALLLSAVAAVALML